jgi:hypothetical protein
MYFDWVTWSIWLVGFAILVCWCWIPVREFRQLLKDKRSKEPPRTDGQTRT